MAQMNPLIGPKLHNTTILLMAKEWVRFSVSNYHLLFIVLLPYMYNSCFVYSFITSKSALYSGFTLYFNTAGIDYHT